MKKLGNVFAELLYRLSECLREQVERFADRIEDLSGRLYSLEADTHATPPKLGHE